MKRLTHQQFMASKHGCWKLHIHGARYTGVAKRLKSLRRSKAPRNRPIRGDDHWMGRRIQEVECQNFTSVFGT